MWLSGAAVPPAKDTGGWPLQNSPNIQCTVFRFNNTSFQSNCTSSLHIWHNDDLLVKRERLNKVLLSFFFFFVLLYTFYLESSCAWLLMTSTVEEIDASRFCWSAVWLWQWSYRRVNLTEWVRQRSESVMLKVNCFTSSMSRLTKRSDIQVQCQSFLWTTSDRW